MDTPPLDSPTDRMHLLLAERGRAILPEAGHGDGRVTLTDAMLAVAALAPCFALARASIGLGLASLALVLPALARTHVVMVRGRALGLSPNAGHWLVAFLSSTIRVALIVAFVGVIHAASLALGGFLGSRSALVYVNDADGPGTALARQAVIPSWTFYGAVLGFAILGVPLTLLALAILIPRFLVVRDPT